jgi:Lon protease-like protein
MPQDIPLEGEFISDNRQLPATPPLPTELYLLPLTEKPFFPAQTLPLLMNEAPWLSTVAAIGDTTHHMVGLVVVKPDNTDDVKRSDFRSIGTAVRIHHPVKTEGKMQFIAEGIRRFRIVEWISDTPPYRVRVEYPNEPGKPDSEVIRAYSIAIINTIKELLPLNPLYSEELKFFLNRYGPNEPSQLTDFAASLTTASKHDLQEVLEAFSLKKRMEKVLVLLKKELDVARLQSQIREKVDEKMTEQQREFFLRQQLKAIQKELGLAKDDKTAELDTLRERIAKLNPPEQAKKRIDEEMHKLSLLETGSPEYTVTRNYLDWLTVLPWGVLTQDKLDLARARKILDRDHDGLEDVKDRIIEFLAVGAMKGEMAGSILLLIGPPGVGKTSIGKSIAEALGRKFFRFSVGGMRDEAEIKGHRRTYIGAMPGKFVQALKEAGSANPVIMLDEVDKIGASYHGDPASALLEVLDPEQNADFLDHYLDVRFDLSKTLFICTANEFSIPAPLLDRMEVIRLSGYITEEKLAIAKHHLWPRVLEKGRTEEEPADHHRGRHPPRHRGLRPRIGRAQPGKATGTGGTQGRGQDPRRRADTDQDRRQGDRSLSRQAGVHPREAAGWRGGGDRAGLDRDGRLDPAGGGDPRPHPQPRLQAHRQARRGDEGIGRDRLQLHRLAPQGLRRRREILRYQLRPPARARGRHAQGWPQRRRHHGHGPAVAGEEQEDHSPAGDDRRTDPDRPGAAGRRHPREGHRRAPGRHPRTDPAGGQPPRFRQAAGLHPRRHQRAFRQALPGCGGGGVSGEECGGTEGRCKPCPSR